MAIPVIDTSSYPRIHVRVNLSDVSEVFHKAAPLVDGIVNFNCPKAVHAGRGNEIDFAGAVPSDQQKPHTIRI
jgi:hypothetical protein